MPRRFFDDISSSHNFFLIIFFGRWTRVDPGSCRDAKASCVLQVLKLVSLSYSLVTADQEFNTVEERLIVLNKTLGLGYVSLRWSFRIRER